MIKRTIFLFLILTSISSYACDCECIGNCTFKSMANGSNFVALVKVIEYSDYLEDKIPGYDGKMPLSMTVEIIKKYKGNESRKRIKIWGDNGALCRPYTAHFKIGKYYLIAPSQIVRPNENELKTDYEFFSCAEDFMEVDFKNKVAFGEYTKSKEKISLEKFERKLK